MAKETSSPKTNYTVPKGTHCYTNKPGQEPKPIVTTKANTFTEATKMSKTYIFKHKGWRLIVFQGYVDVNEIEF